MPRYKLQWTETVLFGAEITARDIVQARQKYENWDSEVSDSCEEIDFLDKSDVEIEVIRRTRNNANINSIN